MLRNVFLNVIFLHSKMLPKWANVMQEVGL